MDYLPLLHPAVSSCAAFAAVDAGCWVFVVVVAVVVVFVVVLYNLIIWCRLHIVFRGRQVEFICIDVPD